MLTGLPVWLQRTDEVVNSLWIAVPHGDETVDAGVAELWEWSRASSEESRDMAHSALCAPRGYSSRQLAQAVSLMLRRWGANRDRRAEPRHHQDRGGSNGERTDAVLHRALQSFGLEAGMSG